MRITRTFAFFILSVSLLAPPAFGADLTWTGGTNTDWRTASNWSPQQAPQNGDTLTINPVANMPANLQSGYGVINFTGGTLVMDGPKEFGPKNSSMDTVFNQTGGSLETGSRIIFGLENSIKTTYNLRDGATLKGDVVHIGNCAEGVWNIDTGATATLGNDLWVGLYNNASTGAGNGTLNMYGGSLTAKNISFGHTSGTQGEGNLYSGTVTVNSGLFVGRGGTGTLLIDGANLTTTAASNVGTDKGTGTVTIDSGSMTASSELYVGNGTDSTGTLTINDGNLTVGTTTNGKTYIGNGGGTGTFNLNGGTVTLKYQDIYLGNNAGSKGYLYQTGGTLDAAKLWFNIGEHGTGHYEISGGTMESTVLSVGRRGEGTMIMSEPDPSNPTKVTTKQLHVGYNTSLSGNSSLQIDGGTLTVIDSTDREITAIGFSKEGTVGAGTSSLIINGGLLDLQTDKDFVLGNKGSNSDLIINGGELLFKGPNMLLGDGAGAIVNIEINGGKLNHQGRTGLFIGHNGSKTEMTINNDGQLIFNGGQPFRIGNGTSGKLILNDGLIDYQSSSHLLVGDASGTGELIIHDGLLDIKTATDLRVGSNNAAASILMTGGEFRHVAGGNFVLMPTTANGGKGSLFVMTGGDFNGAYISINQLGGNDARTATMELSGGTVNLKNQLRVGQDGWGTLTVSGGKVTADSLLVDVRNAGSVFNLIGSKSEWELGSMTSNANAKINLQLDSDGLSPLDVSGTAAVNGTVSDILSIPGAAIVKTNSVDFVSAGSLTSTPTFNSSAFTQTANGGTLSYTFNDSNLDTLKFGDDHQSITLATPQESGWIRLEQSGAADNSTLNISVVGALGAGTVDDLLMYLNDSLDGFGYEFKEADSMAGLHLFDLNINPLNSEGYAYFGWDFEGFNNAYADAEIGLFGAGAIGASGGSGVPEPATWLMLLLGAAAMGICYRKRG